MSKAPWYPRDAGCSVVGGGEPTFNYIPISSNTSPQFSSIFLHFHQPCSIFLVLVFFRSGSTERPIFWAKGFLAAKKSRSDVRWIKNADVCIIWRHRMNMGLCLYGGEDGGASPNPESVGYNKICQILPWLCQQKPPPPPWGENSIHPSIGSRHESASSPSDPIKVWPVQHSPPSHKIEPGYGLRWNGKTFSKFSDDSHPAAAEQWVKEQAPIFRSKSRGRGSEK